MNSKINFKNFILIIIFSIIFSNSVTSGIRTVLIKFLEIPIDSITWTQWGDTFFLHILASLAGTATSAFVVGTFLKNKARLAAIIATVPVFAFWLVVLVSNFFSGQLFGNIKVMLILPSILVILSPAVSYFSAGWGHNFFDDFQRPKSILGIRWYHWLWILSFYLTEVVAVLLYAFLLPWSFDNGVSSSNNLIIDLIVTPGNIIFWIMFLIPAGLFISVSHVYHLLSAEVITTRINWKNGIMIFCHVFLFFILFLFLLVLPIMEQ